MAKTSRVKQSSKVRLANSPETREFLDAGVRLLGDVLGTHGEAEDLPFIRWISMDAVISEASPDLVPSEGKFRDRWLSLSDYHLDLLSYILWSQHLVGHREVVDAAESLLANGNLVEAVQRVAYEELKLMLPNAPERFVLLSMGVGMLDEDGQTVASHFYAMANEAWSGVYQRALERRGLKLRPDVSIDEFTNVLTALANGISLRAVGEHGAGVIDHDAKESLLGKAALMIAAACIDPGDGLGLEEAAGMVLAPRV
jgi:hypothetical protein